MMLPSTHDHLSTVFAILLSFGLMVGLAAGSMAENFVEDFSSLEYCDVGSTTACWDTEAGQLRLHPYPMYAEAGINVIKTASCFARSGDHVFLGISEVGIHVLDISDIHKMEYVGEFLWVEFPRAMWAEGNHLYVAALDRFIVFDISDPTNLMILGESSAMSQINDVAVSGDLAFLSSCNAGFYCVDISDPETPALIGQVDTPSCAQSLTLYGDHAYVCTGYTGISVIDISDPSLPVHVNQLPASYHPERIHVAGGLAYVAEISKELLIYSLVDPAAPALLGACELPGHALDVDVSGTLAYISIGDPDTTGICAVDVSDPAEPRVLSSAELVGFPVGVELFGEFALVNSLTLFLAVRIADPLPPMPAGELADPTIFDFRVDGHLAYVLAWELRDQVFYTVSLAEPEEPAILGGCTLSSYPMDLALSPPYAYIGNFGPGLEVLDIRDPVNPHIVCTMDLDRSGVSVLPHGDHLFLGYIDAGVGLMTLDVSDPTNPVPLNELPLDYSPREMCRSGDHLFVIQWEDGSKGAQPASRSAPLQGDRHSNIMVLDISIPTAPVPVATFAVPEAYVEFMHIDGDLLYASFWSYEDWYGNGFVIFDISNPLDPFSLSRWEDGDGLGQLVLAGDLAIQAGGRQIDVLDVSDPTSPLHLHSMPTERETIWLGAGGDYLFGSGGYGGLRSVRVFDRSADVLHNVAQSLTLPATETPLSHVRMGSVQTPSLHWEFSADAGEHWQTLLSPGLWLVLDHPGSEPCWRANLLYSEIGEPPVVDELSLEWISGPTSLNDDTLPATFALHAAAPNPFNPATTIRFDLPHTCQVRVEIFDVSGRRLRRLVDAELPAGQQQITFDGCNDAGILLGSGLYICRMQAGGFDQSQKLVLIK